MKLVWVVSILAACALSSAASAAETNHVSSPSELVDEPSRAPVDLHRQAVPAHSQSRYERKQRGCRAVPVPDECLN
ncbi:MAG: hypothetical protein JWM36_816 [Hyphomicrobiales bacterium]|nr:hypothetical protein [Hyphomicrobiales bacterium]